MSVSAGNCSSWVSDSSYIHTKQGVLHLSMIRDLYGNGIAAYKTGTEQTVNLVLDTIPLPWRIISYISTSAITSASS